MQKLNDARFPILDSRFSPSTSIKYPTLIFYLSFYFSDFGFIVGSLLNWSQNSLPLAPLVG